MIIYALISPTGRTYIGQTRQDMHTRWAQHRSAARRGIHSKLYSSMRKHAPETWTKTVICECDSQEQLDEMEVFLISEFGDLNLDGGGCAGKMVSAETRSKISASLSGKKHSDETKARMAVAHTGRKHTDKAKAKMSASCVGRKRPPPSDEARARMSAASKGKKKSPAHAAAIRAGKRRAAAAAKT